MDRINRIQISDTEFAKLLSDFNESVGDGNYQKLDYESWRSLKRLPIEHRSITLDVCRDFFGNIVVAIVDEPFGDFIFEQRDGSFGDFLCDYLELEKEDKSMPIAESDCTRASTASDYLVYEPALIYTSGDSWCSVSTKADLAEVHALQEKVSNEIEKMREEYRKNAYEQKAAIGAVEAELNKITNTNQPMKEENENMKGFNFTFGPVNANTVRMSMYGLAVKNKSGTWVSYNAANDEIMDVEIFNFDGAKFLFQMPVAINAVQAGDVIVHAGVPMFVQEVYEKTLYAIDPVYGEKKEILLTKSPFGFNFVTKVVNFLDGAFGTSTTPDANNPFGNMWMFMAMGDDKLDMETVLMMSMVGGNGMNPQMMLPLLMAKNGGLGDKMDGLALMLAMQAMNQPQAHTCNCGGNCGHHE